MPAKQGAISAKVPKVKKTKAGNPAAGAETGAGARAGISGEPGTLPGRSVQAGRAGARVSGSGPGTAASSSQRRVASDRRPAAAATTAAAATASSSDPTEVSASGVGVTPTVNGASVAALTTTTETATATTSRAAANQSIEATPEVATHSNGRHSGGRPELPLQASDRERGGTSEDTASPIGDRPPNTSVSPSGAAPRRSQRGDSPAGAGRPNNTSTPVASGSGSGTRPVRPHSDAPPTYEESAYHLTLEYGGYFVPYEGRPLSMPLAVSPGMSFPSMNPGRAAAPLAPGSPLPASDRRRLPALEPPRRSSRSSSACRRSRRVGDLSLTNSERVVMTESVIRDLEAPEEETNDRCTKLLLPPMHICMATTCLVFNCVIPGSGTLVAAFGLFCCTKRSEWSCGKKSASCCLSLLVALAQLILTPVLLIGWIWSILWGFAYVGVSHQEYHGPKEEEEEEDEDELATIAQLQDERSAWARGYQRFDDYPTYPGSAPSHRRMSVTGAGNQQPESPALRQASMLRATRSYGYVEVHGRHGLYGGRDAAHQQQQLARAGHGPGGGRGTGLPGSVGVSASTLSSSQRPLSQMTLTSYINDGMFLGSAGGIGGSSSNPQPTPPRGQRAAMVTVDSV